MDGQLIDRSRAQMSQKSIDFEESMEVERSIDTSSLNQTMTSVSEISPISHVSFGTESSDSLLIECDTNMKAAGDDDENSDQYWGTEEENKSFSRDFILKKYARDLDDDVEDSTPACNGDGEVLALSWRNPWAWLILTKQNNVHGEAHALPAELHNRWVAIHVSVEREDIKKHTLDLVAEGYRFREDNHRSVKGAIVGAVKMIPAPVKVLQKCDKFILNTPSLFANAHFFILH